MTEHAPFLWVGLDGLVRDRVETRAIAAELASVPGNFGFKVNLDYALAVGIGNLRRGPLKERPLFVDLKMLNGARTMTQILIALAHEGVTATNAYALAGGGESYGGDELARSIAELRRQFSSTRMRVYGVTVLTHYGEAYSTAHFRAPLGKVVRMFAEECVTAGADGVIMPGTQLKEVEHLRILKVLPGIRPSWYRDTRHEQETAPEAVAGRSDIEVVCGSPIMKDRDPAAALTRILAALV
ncbi:MAG TPA: orotidine 5'-phosphate decarboxylase / HUMPS family protein [Candidatus Paceibacterota bacterium]|nr:orotidine 5'-phosphate decarboxylase / HUMPS family protein [Candidatus Paceibacterota bacterium]